MYLSLRINPHKRRSILQTANSRMVGNRESIRLCGAGFVLRRPQASSPRFPSVPTKSCPRLHVRAPRRPVSAMSSFPNRSAWQFGAVPPQFSPGHICGSWCQFGVNLRRLCRFRRLCRLISRLVSTTQAIDTSWHGRGHRFDPGQVHQHPPPRTNHFQTQTSSFQRGEGAERC
jgi:hypothetical protein